MASIADYVIFLSFGINKLNEINLTLPKYRLPS